MTKYQFNQMYSATVNGDKDQRVVFADPRDTQLPWFHLPATEYDCGDWVSYASVTDVRPLVTLDIESLYYPGATEHVIERLGHNWSSLCDEIRRQTEGPRIPEPGKWGVVQDAHGVEWFHRGTTQGSSYEWVNIETGDGDDWKDIKQPVEVRPGV